MSFFYSKTFKRTLSTSPEKPSPKTCVPETELVCGEQLKLETGGLSVMDPMVTLGKSGQL